MSNSIRRQVRLAMADSAVFNAKVLDGSFTKPSANKPRRMPKAVAPVRHTPLSVLFAGFNRTLLGR